MTKRAQIGTNGKRNAVALTEEDKRRVTGLRELTPTLLFHKLSMPRDNLNRYYMPGGYSKRTITHMSRMAYSCSANSTAMYARPYATADSLIQRVDQQGEDWTMTRLMTSTFVTSSGLPRCRLLEG